MDKSNIEHAPDKLASMDQSQKPKWCVPASASNYASKASQIPPRTGADSYTNFAKPNDSSIQAMKSKLAVENWADDEDFDDEVTFATKQPPKPEPAPAPQPRNLQKMSFSQTAAGGQFYELESQSRPQKFDQFKENKRLGVWDPKRMCEYNDDMYTTPIPETLTKQQRSWAMQKEREITMSETVSVQHRAERTRDYAGDDGMDEEMLYSSVTSVKSVESAADRPNIYVPPSKRSTDLKPVMAPTRNGRGRQETTNGASQKPREPMRVPTLDIMKAKEISSASIPAGKPAAGTTKLNPNAVAFCPGGAAKPKEQQDSLESVDRELNAMSVSPKPEAPVAAPEGKPPASANPEPKKSMAGLAKSITSSLYEKAKTSKASEKHSEKLNSKPASAETQDPSKQDSAHPMRMRAKKTVVGYAEFPQDPSQYVTSVGDKQAAAEEQFAQPRESRSNIALQHGLSPRGHVQMVSISPRSRNGIFLDKPAVAPVSDSPEPVTVPASQVHPPPHPSMPPQPMAVRTGDAGLPPRPLRTPARDPYNSFPPHDPYYPQDRFAYDDGRNFHKARPTAPSLELSPYSPEPRRTMEYVQEVPLADDSPIQIGQRHPDVLMHGYPPRPEHPVQIHGFAHPPMPHMRPAMPNILPGQRPSSGAASLPLRPTLPEIVYDEATNSITVGVRQNPQSGSSLNRLIGENVENGALERKAPEVQYAPYTKGTDIVEKREKDARSVNADENTFSKGSRGEGPRSNVPRTKQSMGKPRRNTERKTPSESPMNPRGDVGKSNRFSRLAAKGGEDDGEGPRKADFADGKRRSRHPRGFDSRGKDSVDAGSEPNTPKHFEGRHRGRGRSNA